MMRVFHVLVFVAVLAGCTNRDYTPTMPTALTVGKPYTILAATTRVKNPDGNFGYDRSNVLQRLELTVSIPPSHTPGELKYAYANPDPKTEFTMAGRKEFASSVAFRTRVNQIMASLDKSEREVTVFIHGYNETQAETAFRAAQLGNDIGLPGALVIYSWPSRAKVLGYAYDIDSALFARDGLEQLLYELQASSARRILLVAHSMGSLVMMETLRQIDQKRPGWVGNNIGGIVLISPDLDVDLFKRQMNGLTRVPKPFVVFVSKEDKVLIFSARIRNTKDRERLGNIKHVDQLAELPIDIIDTTAFSKGAGSSHLVAGTSPALISMISQARSLDVTFAPNQASIEHLITGAPGHRQGAVHITLLPGVSGAK